MNQVEPIGSWTRPYGGCYGEQTMKFLVLSLVLMLNLGFAVGSSLPVNAQSTTEIARGNCKAASDKCQATLDYCTKMKGKLGEANVTDALKDCIAVCNAAEKILARNSVLTPKMSDVTIESCNLVAKACDQFPSDLKMQACANEVRKCVGNLQKVASKKTTTM